MGNEHHLCTVKTSEPTMPADRGASLRVSTGHAEPAGGQGAPVAKLRISACEMLAAPQRPHPPLAVCPPLRPDWIPYALGTVVATGAPDRPSGRRTRSAAHSFNGPDMLSVMPRLGRIRHRCSLCWFNPSTGQYEARVSLVRGSCRQGGRASHHTLVREIFWRESAVNPYDSMTGNCE